MPAVALEAPRRVVGEGEIGGAVDGDAIVVVDADQLAEPLVAGEGARFVRNPLHQVAVGAQEVRMMIDDRVARPVEQRRELRLGDRHPHRVADALAERSRRRLDPRREAELGMARRAAAPLPELLDFIQRQVIPGEIEHRVEQHAGVAARQHEAVTVGPVGMGGIETQMPLPQHPSEWGQRHGRAGMPGVGLLYRVHRDGAHGVDAQQLERGVARAGDTGHLGAHSPDFAACHSLINRSKPPTRRSTCCGDGLALAAVSSSITSRPISLRFCFWASTAI